MNPNTNIYFNQKKLIRRFLKKLEHNLNNYVPLSTDTNNTTAPYVLEFETVVGLSKTFETHSPRLDKGYYLQFNCTFYSDIKKIFFGNCAYSQLVPISFDQNSNIILDIDQQNNPVRLYFFGTPQEKFKCIFEIVFVTTSLERIIEKREVLGWCMINEPTNSLIHSAVNIYLGTCRELIYRDMNGIQVKPNSSVVFSLQRSGDVDVVKKLIPDYYFFNCMTEIPGLLMRKIPNVINPTEQIKAVQFETIYIKNIEIELNANFIESEILKVSSQFQKNKDGANTNNNVKVEKRTLYCYIHNTYKNLSNTEEEILNSPLKNKVELIQKGNYLYYQGSIGVDGYFIDEFRLCGLVVELSYTISIFSFGNNYERIELPIATTLIIPGQLSYKNIFESNIMTGGPGKNLSGNEMIKLKNTENIPISIHYVLSKNKEAPEETYQDKQIEEISNKVSNMQNELVNERDPQKAELMQSQMSVLQDQLNQKQEEYKDMYNRESIRQDPAGNPLSNSNQFGSVLNQDHQFLIDQNKQPPEEIHKPSNTAPLPGVGNNLENQFELTKEAEKLQSGNYNYFEEQKRKAMEMNNSQDFPQNPQNQFGTFPQNPQNQFGTFPQNPQNQFGTFPQIPQNQFGTFPQNPQNQFGTDFNNFQEFKENSINESNALFSKTAQTQFVQTQNVYKHQPEKGIVYQKDFSKTISLSEQANLVSKGILALDPSEDKRPIIEYTYETEISHRKFFGDIFTFNFTSFKPLKNITSFDEIPGDILFKFSFWDFESFSTFPAQIMRPLSGVPSSAPMAIQKLGNKYARTEEKEMKVSITFDPSVDDYIDYRTFINYLLLHSLFILIFDYEKQMDYGFIKIPLKILLKQGKGTIYDNYNFDIFDLKTFDVKGQIQMTVKSEEIRTYKEYTLENNIKSDKFKFVYTINSVGNFKKKKVATINPFNMNTLTNKEKEYLAKNLYEEKRKKEIEDLSASYTKGAAKKVKSANTFYLDPEAEKRVRVLRYMHNTTNNDKSSASSNQKNQVKTNMVIPNEIIEKDRLQFEQQSKFFETLNYSNRIKEMNKEKILKKTITENNKNNLTIALVQGQPHFFNYVIHNESNKQECFHIVISSNKETTQTLDRTVTIVTDPQEYQRITKLYQLKIPNDFNSIDFSYNVIAKPFESIPIIVKLLSYTNEPENSIYTVWVYNQKSIPVHFMTITIPKIFPIIDHVFTYNVPLGKFSNISFVNPFKYNRAKTEQVLNNMVSREHGLIIKVDSRTNDFFFKHKASKNENDVYENLIFIYHDEFGDSLFATWKFEIYSRDVVEIPSRFGVRGKNTLNLFPVFSPKTVKFYSSDPEVLFFTEKFSQPIVLVPQIRYDVEFVLFPKKSDLIEVTVTCVDYATKEVIKTWIVKSQPNQPEVSQLVRLNVKTRTITNVQFEYTNPLNEWAVLRFESSSKNILTLIQDMYTFNSEETKMISCEIKPQNSVGQIPLYLFVTDAEDLFNQTILFEINYY